MAITTDVREKFSSDVSILKQNWPYFNGYPRSFSVMEQGEDERGKFYAFVAKIQNGLQE